MKFFPNRILILNVILIFAFISVTNAQSGKNNSNKKRPKVGLVLSGGGAKGLAHIGVLKVLEEVGMPIDYIGGTSMGSLVSALYSIGYSIDSLENLITAQNWDFLLSDKITRRDLSITEKKDKDRFRLTFPMSSKGLELPAGIIRGQHIQNLFTELCSPVYKIRDFHNLPIPYLCIALDIETGEKVLLNKGNLPDAMRASMSIPSVFEPMEIDGHKLVDGGLIDNFPVSDVKAMGADIIIGVDVGHGSQGPKEKLSMFSIMENAMFLYSEKVMEQSLKQVNLLIKPNLHGLGTASFTDDDSLMAYGEYAAREVYDQLKALADSINSLGGPAYSRKSAEIIDSVYIKSIQVKGLYHMTKKLVTADLPFSVLEWVNVKDITRAVENIYASNYFNKVTYELLPEDDGVRLLLKFKERDMGSLRFGFYYDNDYSAMLFLNTTFYNALIKNTRFSATVGLGRTPSVELLYFMDKGPIPAPGIQIYGQYTNLSIYDDSVRNKLATVNSYYLSSKLFLQSNFSNTLYMRAGIEWLYTKYTPNISLIDFGAFLNNSMTLFFETHFDTYDKAYFATKGSRGNIYAKLVGDGTDKPFLYSRFDYRFAQKISNKFVLNPKFYGGAIVGDSIPITFGFPLGGFTEPGQLDQFPLVGYKYFELGGYLTFIARVDFRYQFYKKFYLTLMANAGLNNDSPHEIFDKRSFVSGFGLALSMDTPIGPISVAVSRAGEKPGFLGHVQIGYWF